MVRRLLDFQSNEDRLPVFRTTVQQRPDGAGVLDLGSPSLELSVHIKVPGRSASSRGEKANVVRRDRTLGISIKEHGIQLSNSFFLT